MERAGIAKLHDAVPLVAGTAERAVLFPSPDLNQRVQRLDTGCIQRWNGTEWVNLLCPGEGGDGGTFPQAQYVVIALSDDLTSERRLQVGAGLTMQDGGANADVTLSVTCPNYCGTGSPEGVVTAAVGSWYLQRDAASTTHPLWAKRSGTGNTGWVAYAGHRGTGTQSLAFGDSSAASATDAQSFGQSANASAADTLAVGRSSVASAADATAIGRAATASAATTVAVGQGATSAATDGIAIGRAASVGTTATSGIAIGPTATVAAAGSLGIAIGDTATTNPNEINIGANNVIGSQPLGTDGSILIGHNITSSDTRGQGTVAIGEGITADWPDSFSAQVMIGAYVQNHGYENVLIGYNAVAQADDAPVTGLPRGTVVVGVGENVSLNGDCVVAIGHDAWTRSDFSVALGPHSRAGEDETTNSCVAVGRYAAARGHRSTSIGTDSIVASAHTGSIALGFDAETSAAGQLMIGSVAQPITSVVVSGTKILGVQGAAVADATDAGSAITQLNLALARLRAHGLIAT